MHVERYDVFLNVDFLNLRLDGKVLATLESEDDVVLNSLGLRISSVASDGRSFRFDYDAFFTICWCSGGLHAPQSSGIQNSLALLRR